MSNSVVAAAAVSRAKHLVANKKIKKLTEDQRPAREEQQAADREHQTAHVVETREANGHSSVVESTMSGDFSFASALAGAAQDSASLTGFQAEGDSGSSDDGSSGSGVLLAIGAVGLVGAGVAVLASGGGSKKENQAPTITPATQAITTAEDTAKVFNVTAADPDNDTLTFTATGATKGTVAIGANGALTYTPNANANGTDEFTVTVKDPDGLTATQKVTVTITPVDDAPVADAGNTDTLQTAEDTQKEFVISYTDPDTGKADGLTVEMVTGPAHGTISADGKFYIPTANYNGPDSFTYKVIDTTGTSTTHTVNVTVTPVNDAPVTAASQAVQAVVDTALPITVTATDVDAGDTLTYTAGTGASGPAHGTVAAGATPGAFTYTPTAGYVGVDAFTVTVSDGHGGTTSQVVNITVGNPVTTETLDKGNPFGSGAPVTITLGDGAYNLTNDADVNSFVVIKGLTTGAGHDDQITFTNLSNISELNFGTTADGHGLKIEYQNPETDTAEKIVIEDVFTNPVFIEKYADVTAALGFNLINLA